VVIPTGLVTLASMTLAIAVLIMWRRRSSEKRLTIVDLPTRASMIEENVQKVQTLQITKLLGTGNYAEVYLGNFDGTPVACKKLKNKEDQADFEKEALTISKLTHPHVVQFLGIHGNEKGEKFLVFEYLAGGSLVDYVQCQGESMTAGDLNHLIIEAARGMVYLESKGVVHRDIALRNFLVDSNKRVKVSDFGMAIRAFYQSYDDNEEKNIPVRWSAPEILRQAPPTSKSDAYSFAVFMWEVYELGKIPFGGYSNNEVIRRVVDEKEVLPKPKRCPITVYALMLKCFAYLPSKRPTFREIHDTMEEIQNNIERGGREQRRTVTKRTANSTVSSDDLYANDPRQSQLSEK